jgi:hypothetical protein
MAQRMTVHANHATRAKVAIVTIELRGVEKNPASIAWRGLEEQGV